MNKWVKKSTELAYGDFYLDKLLDVYPPEEISRGLIVEKASPNLKKLFKQRNCKVLIKELIRLKELGFKFPIDNPYISFLSYHKEAMEGNPETLKKICAILLKLDYDELKERLEAPKRASRRIGPMFKVWLKNNFEFLEMEEFKEYEGLSFLSGGDRSLKIYVEENLQCRLGELSKGLDFVSKIKNKYLIGTAKFITDTGGGQTGQFFEAIRLIKEAKCPKHVTRIAVIDGVPWLGGKMKAILGELRDDENCLSVLLLKEFIREFT